MESEFQNLERRRNGICKDKASLDAGRLDWAKGQVNRYQRLDGGLALFEVEEKAFSSVRSNLPV